MTSTKEMSAHARKVAGAQSRTMKKLPCRACSGMLELNKVVALFCFLNSSYHWFPEAFVYLSGVLSPLHPSICSCACELSAAKRRQAGQSSPILCGQQSVDPTCTQRCHKKLKGNAHRLMSIFDSYATLYCPNICGLTCSRMATHTEKPWKFSPTNKLSAYGI